MGKCILRFSELQILNQKSNSHYSDNDWLSIVWGVNEKVVSTKTVPLYNRAGSQVLHSGDVIKPYEDYAICEDTDFVTVSYVIVNLGYISDFAEQAEAASRITGKLLEVITPIYLKAGAAALGSVASLEAPVIAEIIAGAAATLIDKYAHQIGELINQGFEEYVTPAIVEMVEYLTDLFGGEPNCNGEVLHDYVVFKPRHSPIPTVESKEYYSGQSNSSCGDPAHTVVRFSSERDLDYRGSSFGSIIQPTEEELVMAEFRHADNFALRQHFVGAYPTFQERVDGNRQYDKFIFLNSESAEVEEVPQFRFYGNPSPGDFHELFQAAVRYARTEGFGAGFPTFYNKEGLTGALTPQSFKMDLPDTVKSPLGSEFRVLSAARMNPPSSFKSQEKMNISFSLFGQPTTWAMICKIILIRQEFVEARNVKLSDLKNSSLADIKTLFKVTQEYASDQGYLGGFPTFIRPTTGLGLICETILIKREAGEILEVLVRKGP